MDALNFRFTWCQLLCFHRNACMVRAIIAELAPQITAICVMFHVTDTEPTQWTVIY